MACCWLTMWGIAVTLQDSKLELASFHWRPTMYISQNRCSELPGLHLHSMVVTMTLPDDLPRDEVRLQFFPVVHVPGLPILRQNLQLKDNEMHVNGSEIHFDKTFFAWQDKLAFSYICRLPLLCLATSGVYTVKYCTIFKFLYNHIFSGPISFDVLYTEPSEIL